MCPRHRREVLDLAVVFGERDLGEIDAAIVDYLHSSPLRVSPRRRLFSMMADTCCKLSNHSITVRAWILRQQNAAEEILPAQLPVILGAC
ncbi:MAG: hypothetical protein M1423_08895 [Acidobacteria bacterium]|nr:hypothetical protein [Acidobacteriota bacterium]